VVLLNHRCDGTVDCEDGTDEEACDCRTRLANVYGARAVCDGVVDCHDGSDETECGGGTPICKHDETMCGWPRKCVKKTAWCDGVIDCGGGDGRDEKYCSRRYFNYLNNRSKEVLSFSVQSVYEIRSFNIVLLCRRQVRKTYINLNSIVGRKKNYLYAPQT